MSVDILDPARPDHAAIIARRHALGIDKRDEIWEGVYRMSPAPQPRHGIVAYQLGDLLRAAAKAAGLIGSTEFNIGERSDFRVPDLGFHRTMPDTTYVPTAALIVEVLSPGDDTWAKLPHYAACGVGEIVVADVDRHTVEVLTLDGDRYVAVARSGLLGMTGAELQAAIDWPPA